MRKQTLLAVAAIGYMTAQPAIAQTSQRQLDDRSLSLRQSAEIMAARERLLTALQKDSVAAQVGARLERDADEIVMGAIQDNINTDRGCPVFFRYFAPEHEIDGRVIPSGKFMMTNPDTVFRYFALDPRGIYRIDGRFANPRSAYLSMHVEGGGYGDLNILFDSDLKVDHEGRFIVTVGPSEAEGKATTHITISPEAKRLFVRDTLADWGKEKLTTLRVARLDPAPCEIASDRDLIARAVAAIDRMPQNIVAFRDVSFLSLPKNTIAPPVIYPKSTWAQTAYGRFDLTEEEVMVIRLRTLGARYLGVQTSDRATGTIEPHLRPSSLNSHQTIADDDGAVTMLLAPRDPGYSHWIDTGGVTEGQIWVRWQGLPSTPFASNQAIESVAVVKRRDLGKVLRSTNIQKISKASRQRQYARHRVEYGQRYSE